MIRATGVIEEWAAGPRIGYELVVLPLDHQLRLQTRHSAVDAGVLSGVDSQHRRLQVWHIFQRRGTAVEGNCGCEFRVANGHQPDDAAAETEARCADPVSLDVRLILQETNCGVAIANYLVGGDVA